MRGDRMDRIVLYAGTYTFWIFSLSYAEIKYHLHFNKKKTFKYCFYVSVNLCIHCENFYASGNLSQRHIIY